jgi:hypothetical protein
VSDRRVLVWKHEESARASDAVGSSTDAGPAWIDTYRGSSHLSQEQVAGGRWVTRAEAQDLAEQLGCEIELDDGIALDTARRSDLDRVDVAGINRKLRKVGIADDQLRVEWEDDALTLVGSLVDSDPSLPQLPGAPPRDVRHVIQSEEGLSALLNRLAPEWGKVDRAT